MFESSPAILLYLYLKIYFIMHRTQSAPRDTALSQYFGYSEYATFGSLKGWLLNYTVSEKTAGDNGRNITVGTLYFIGEHENFRIDLPFSPALTLEVKADLAEEISEHVLHKYAEYIREVVKEKRTDLSDPAHMKENARKNSPDEKENSVEASTNCHILIRCFTEADALSLRRDLEQTIKNKRIRDKEKAAVLLYSANQQYGSMENLQENAKGNPDRVTGPLENLEAGFFEVHEYDIPTAVQFATERDIHAGQWYKVTYNGDYTLEKVESVLPPEIRMLSFDIETTKDPLKFPDPEKDKVMMVSLMSTSGGWLVVNREIVSQDIGPFDFRPTKEIGGEFEVYNEPAEKETLEKFLLVLHTYRPHVITSYNGDGFDWPFLERRMQKHGMSLGDSTGMRRTHLDEYVCDFLLHLDCFRWVKRDSYLPAGSHGLKSVTRAKLGYFPDEIDPEEMLPLARSEPRVLASYSVSDAVATYFLYVKYVHPFIFSLASIIPLAPDAVLRRGSGTLCESLLIKEARNAQVLVPARKKSTALETYKGKVAESLSYVGGRVECLRSGIFRADFQYKFEINPETLRIMAEEVHEVLDLELNGEEAENYQEILEDIKGKLMSMAEQKSFVSKPKLFHLDVGAMYPNIILTNRLQPVAVTTEEKCMQCPYFASRSTCQHKMEWNIRAEVFPVGEKKAAEISKGISRESEETGIRGAEREKGRREERLREKLNAKLAAYAKKITGKTKEVIIEKKEALICQRAHPFYVSAVKKFKDRRYTYKAHAKEAKKKAGAQNLTETERKEEIKKAEIYDSLQVAHKCVLNSFYGYVMKKGARWHSMEMAAVVCHAGSRIIQRTKEVVEAFGITLELDTDGIWALLPATLPASYTFRTKAKKPSGAITEKKPGTQTASRAFSYVCSFLNHMLVREFTNRTAPSSPDDPEPIQPPENTIRFEIDGPYGAMFLPASEKEGASIKKRYIVLDEKGKISELKGFEFKRRGELKFIKMLQQDIFSSLTRGSSLSECYAFLADCANYWLDLIEEKGAALSDDEIFEYFGETRSISRDAESYSASKSACLTALGRASELLQQSMSGKGTSCAFIISRYPEGESVTSRALPQVVFRAEATEKEKYLKKWLGGNFVPENLRDIIDWGYYRERLGNVAAKIIIVPAALQGLKNPLPRIPAPFWTQQGLQKLLPFLVKAPSKKQKLEPGVPESRPGDKKETEKSNIDSAQCLPEPSPQPESLVYKSGIKRSWNSLTPTSRPRVDGRHSLPVALAITKTGKGTFTYAAAKGRDVEYVTVALDKVFYLLAEPEAVKRIMNLHKEKKEEKEKKLRVEVVQKYLSGTTQKRNLVRVTLPASKYYREERIFHALFHAPEVQQVLENEVPDTVRALEITGFAGSRPFISISSADFGGKTHYAVYSQGDTSLVSVEDLRAYISDSPEPLLVFGTKGLSRTGLIGKDEDKSNEQPPKKKEKETKQESDPKKATDFVLIPCNVSVQKAAQGWDAFRCSLVSALEKVRAEAEERMGISQYLCAPLIAIGPDQGLLFSDFMHYLFRKSKDLIGWTEIPLSSESHFSLGLAFCAPLKKGYHQPGVYEGISLEMRVEGAALMAVAEAESLLEPGVLCANRDLHALQNLAKKIVLDKTEKKKGADAVFKHTLRWLKAGGPSLTRTLRQYVMLLQTKFVSGLAESIKCMGIDVVLADYEGVVVHTSSQLDETGEALALRISRGISQLEYGTMLNLTVTEKYKQVVLLDRSNYYIVKSSGEVLADMPLPPAVVGQALDGQTEEPLEYISSLLEKERGKQKKEIKKRQVGVPTGTAASKVVETSRSAVILAARALLAVYEAKPGVSAASKEALAQKLAVISGISAFSESLRRPFGSFGSVTLCCLPCAYESTFYVSHDQLPGADFEEYLISLLKRERKRVACKKCNEEYARQYLEEAAKSQIHEITAAYIKRERKCRACKKPAPGIVCTRCICGDLFEDTLRGSSERIVKDVLSVVAVVPLVPLVEYVKQLHKYMC